MKREISDYAKSVRARLLHLTRTTDHSYMYLLARYFSERLIYRVSKSRFSDNFLLKGGSLLYAINGLESRPTVDVDFMAKHIDRNQENLRQVMREILGAECAEDGVVFELNTLRAEPIAVDNQYPGSRFFVTAHLDTIVFPMSIDLGFGDAVTPHPVVVEYPTLLQDLPAANVKAYPLETLIAEKFHTMIERDVSNSRMKDFFDCYIILKEKNFDKEMLYGAIKATFDNRRLEYNAELQLFSKSFCDDESRLLRWDQFLKRIGWVPSLPFREVMDIIARYLQGLYMRYWSEHARD